MEKMSAVERADAVNEIRLLASIKFDYSQCLVHVLQRACWLLRGCWQPSNAAQFFMSHEQWRRCGTACIVHAAAPVCRHENVCRYHEAFLDGNHLCIVMSFAPNGDLARWIRKGQELRKVPFTRTTAPTVPEFDHIAVAFILGMVYAALVYALPSDSPAIPATGHARGHHLEVSDRCDPSCVPLQLPLTYRPPLLCT